MPRERAVGLEQVDRASSARVWSVGQNIAQALRRSAVGCEGINLLVCEGEAAFQTVFHLHLHVIPRYRGEGYRDLNAKPRKRDRSLLDNEAQVVKTATVATAR